MQPLLAVPGGASRVHHSHEHLLHTETALSDLGDDQVRVIAVGGGDEHVCALDPGLDQRVGLQRRSEREHAVRFLPAARLAGVQALVGELVLVEHGHFVPGGKRDLAIADPTRPAPTIKTNIERELEVDMPAKASAGGSARPDARPRRWSSRRLASRHRAAGAVTITRHGLADHLLGGLPDEVLQRAAATAEARAAPDPRGLLGAEHDRFHAAPARLLEDRLSRRRARIVAVATCTPEYSSPTAFARANAWRACLTCASGSRASSGSDIGISKIQTASIVETSCSPRSARRRPARRRSEPCPRPGAFPTAAPGSSRTRVRADARRAAPRPARSRAATARFHPRVGRSRTAAIQPSIQPSPT